ncbi:MAG: DUF99 family protein [Pseudomonadota bacterium]
MPSKLNHVIAFDDAPFAAGHRGDVPVVGVVYADRRPEGVLITRVRRDGANATAVLARAIAQSRHYRHLRLILLQGIALAGFNVVDIDALAAQARLPVLVVVRRRPDMEAVRRALLTRVPGGQRKWRLVERAGLPERIGGCWIQRAAISRAAAEAVLRRFAVYSRVPEPLRMAHLVAGAIGAGESRHRP